MSVSQATFTEALFDPAAPRPTGLGDGKGRAAGRRFDVYRNNVVASLIEALEAGFPVVRKLIGDANFKVLAREFVQAHPPSSPLMMLYGAQMPSFLRGFAPAQSIGYLPDVARLEIALRDSYHSADAAPIDPGALAAIPPDQLMSITMRFVPAARLLRSDWPIHAIWRFNQEGDAPKPVMEAQDVLVVRPGLDPSPQLLPNGAGAFMASLMKSHTLGAAFEDAMAKTPDFDLTQTLTLLISTGAILELGETQ